MQTVMYLTGLPQQCYASFKRKLQWASGGDQAPDQNRREALWKKYVRGNALNNFVETRLKS
jgi:hypothetical protein